MPPGLTIIDRLADLDLRLPEWERLAERSGSFNPFCAPRVWVAWLKSFRQHTPAIFELRCDDRPVAVLPMYRTGERLEMACGPHLDYQDLLAEDHESAVSLLLAVIGPDGIRPTMAVFPKVEADSRLERALGDPRVGAASHLQCRFLTICPTTSYPLRPGQDFIASLVMRQRRDYRNSQNRLSRAVPGFVAEHHGPAGIPDEAFEAAADLHRRNQHRKEGESVFTTPGYLGFLKEQSAAGVPICVSLLRKHPGGPLLAFNVGYFANDTFYYYLTAYAGEHADCSPGRWLLTDSLSHWSKLLIGDTLHFDMLGGEENYKARWAETSYTISRVVLIPRRLGSLPRVLAYTTVYGLKDIKNRLLGREAVNLARPHAEPGDVVLPR